MHEGDATSLRSAESMCCYFPAVLMDLRCPVLSFRGLALPTVTGACMKRQGTAPGLEKEFPPYRASRAVEGIELLSLAFLRSWHNQALAIIFVSDYTWKKERKLPLKRYVFYVSVFFLKTEYGKPNSFPKVKKGFLSSESAQQCPPSGFILGSHLLSFSVQGLRPDGDETPMRRLANELDIRDTHTRNRRTVLGYF